MTDRFLLSALLLVFLLAVQTGYGQELKKATLLPSSNAVYAPSQEVLTDSTYTSNYLRVERIESNGSRSISRQRLHPGGQPVNPSQRVEEITQQLEAIELKWAHLTSDEALHAAAVSSGWFTDMLAVIEALEVERAMLLEQIGAHE